MGHPVPAQALGANLTFFGFESHRCDASLQGSQLGAMGTVSTAERCMHVPIRPRNRCPSP